jgi:hypothetical protein
MPLAFLDVYAAFPNFGFSSQSHWSHCFYAIQLFTACIVLFYWCTQSHEVQYNDVGWNKEHSCAGMGELSVLGCWQKLVVGQRKKGQQKLLMIWHGSNFIQELGTVSLWCGVMLSRSLVFAWHLTVSMLGSLIKHCDTWIWG